MGQWALDLSWQSFLFCVLFFVLYIYKRTFFFNKKNAIEG